MRRLSWLAILFARLSSTRSRAAARCRRRQNLDTLAAVAPLEPRQLLSAGAAAVGFETRVNTYIPSFQSNPATAMDASGRYVAVWQSSFQDGYGTGIFAQRFNAAGVAQGSEFQVNTYTTFEQYGSCVAMDSAGDFVVTWQSSGQDGSNYGIYARRYNSSGVAQGGEFRVNTYTTSDQRNASVDMNSSGNFVITWVSAGQDGSSFGIYAQRYNAAGAALGGEFKVNTYTTGQQYLPSVAMDTTGDFAITWESYAEDGNKYGVYAQRYNSAGAAQGVEFRVNTVTTNDQRQAAIAMDSTGDFVITWKSETQDGSGYGIFAQRYNSAGAAQGVEFKVNTYTTGDQSNPSVAMNPAGDFVVTWQSYAQDGGNYGVYAQRYNSSGAIQGVEFRVNTYTAINQADPSVAMDTAGDFVVVWRSDEQDGDVTGIFAQRYLRTIGPVVTEILDGTGPRIVQNGDRLTSSTNMLSAIFSDDMNVVTLGANSVTNRSNWRLTRYGIDVSNQIAGVVFGFNASLNRYVANITFTQPLSEGTYSLVAQSSIQNLVSESLDGELDGVAGGNFRRNFAIAATFPTGVETRVNTSTTSAQLGAVVATDSTGDFVIAWQSNVQDGSNYGIYAQRYNSAGIAQGSEFKVNTYTTGNQIVPSVAMDASGDFVVAWTSYAEDGSGHGIYAQRFNAAGVAQGSEFKVNTFTTNGQTLPSVAMDSNGDFAIAWSSYGQDGSNLGVYAQRFNSSGTPQGGEFLVNTYTTNYQTRPSVAMDPAGDFVVTWESYNQDGNVVGIFAQRFNAMGIALGSEVQVNTYTTNYQTRPSVAMDSSGDFVVAWQSFVQDGSLYGIYAQRFNSAGITQGSEFRVNARTTNSQGNPSVAMTSSGDFVIAWSTDQDGSLYGIYSQRYNAGGSAQGPEFQINAYTTNNQTHPAVAMDPKGDFVVAWQSYTQDGSGYGVYAQRYQTDVAPLIYQIEDPPLNAVASLNTPLTASLLAYDQDSTAWSSATIRIAINYRPDQDVLGFTNTANITGSWNATTGTLTLSGTDSVSNYRTALRNVTYHNTSGSPNTALTRTIDFQVNDGLLSSGQISRDLTVAAASTPAVLSGVSGAGTFFENAAPLILAANLVISDADSANLASATVSFTGWQAEDRLDFNNIFALSHTFVQDLVAHTALFTITGSSSVDHYQTLLRSVVYSNVSDAPNTAVTRVATFRVNDGSSNSNTVNRNTLVSAVNDPPLLSAIETSPLVYKANDPAFPPPSISATLLVSEPDSNNLTKATVQITAGYQNDANGHDILAFTNQLGITGSFNAATGLLTLTGTSAVGNYRTALRSVLFSASGTTVSTANRTLTIKGTDDFGVPATSLAATRIVTVSTMNSPPGLTGIPTTALAYVRGAAAIAVGPGAIVFDADSINLTGATIQVSANYQNGQDVLAFTSSFGVTGSFVAATGTLTLSGTTSLGNYQTLLRSVTYKTNTGSANTLTRTITFIINDGLALSGAVSRTVTLT